MRVVATFHHPSSVVQSLKCNLTQDQEHLIVAKVNRLEVFSLRSSGLHFECSLEIWGRIVSLKAIPSKDSKQSNLLVLTDHPDPKLIPLTLVLDDTGNASLLSKETIDLHDRYARPAEFVTDVYVDPTGEVAVVSCYTGRLKVIEFKNRERTGIPLDISIPELYILAMTLLYTTKDLYTLSILHYDHQGRLQLLSRDLDLRELSASPSTLLFSTILSSNVPSDSTPFLIPVLPYVSHEENGENLYSSHLGGVVVAGCGNKLLFFEHASQERQEVRKGKQRRASKRMSSGDPAEAAKAKVKEKERETKKIKPKMSVDWPWSEITAWCPADDQGRRFIIGDTFGRLAMLAFDDANGLLLIPLGETSSAVSLTYLSSQVLYLGSHFGESQLLRIHQSPFTERDAETLPIPDHVKSISAVSLPGGKGKERLDDSLEPSKKERGGQVVLGKGKFVEVLDSYENIAPIMDAVMVDLDGSGQPQIIACSGGRNSGALKIIRTGADFQEQAVIRGIENVTDIWPIRSHYEDIIDSHLIATTLHETLVFSLDGRNAVTHMDPSDHGFITRSPTLAVGNIPRRATTQNGGRVVSSYVDSSLVLQVSQEKVRVIEHDAALGLFVPVGDGWDATKEGRTIVAAAINSSQFVLGLSGGRLILLNLGENEQIQELKYRDFGDRTYGMLEISAVSCSPFDTTKKYATCIGVSFWGTNRIAILSLESATSYLTTICESDPLPSLPRSLLLHNFGQDHNPKGADYHPHVLAGLVDGTLVSFSFREKDLKDKKTFALGDVPVALAKSTVDGKPAIFASGSRASVLYWDRQRLHQSPVMIKDAVRGASISSSAFPSCLILATRSTLMIGNVRGVDKMQINSVRMGLDNPRRIAHHPTLRVFAVACIQTKPNRIGEPQETTSSLKLLDDTTFNRIASFACESDEEVTSVLTLSSSDVSSARFCVGTVQFKPGETEPSSGRILLFSLNTGPESSFQLVSSTPVSGCVYQLVSIQGMIAAAVNTSVRTAYVFIAFDPNMTIHKVILFKPEKLNNSTVVLTKVSEWNHNYSVTGLVVHGCMLIVGDAISSISFVKVDDTTLESIARDYSPLWPVSVEAMDGDGVIGANSDCNLFTFALQRSGHRSTLERNGSYYLGDMVNKFLRGSLTNIDISERKSIEPKHLFFTSTGRIGVILEMNDKISLHMTGLQRNMGKRIIGPGGVHHATFRAPANSKGHSDAEAAFGFLDGDFLEQYLGYADYTDLLQGDMDAEQVTMSHSQIQDVLEQLQSLH
ncbi:uncharacterized protein FIBRA_03974 [Fibroporia radiculosa]|uniref:DNA damage-binding protein 1 n=1 Tax=Fibroporia radiculosa TaxID=599839 RepID=J4G6N6_9APHY|nr:uncharacterized protein FIBRA_03974 [Fibroporia radiculosa]CCM01903.1 predicted protein [Fibroporia radiculosa]